MENQWLFEQDDDLQWRWVHLGGESQHVQSAETFQRESDCILDAVRHAVHRRREVVRRRRETSEAE